MRLRRAQQGSVYVETLLVFGLLLVPLWIALDFVYDGGSARVLLGTDVRREALTQTTRADECTGSCGRSGVPAELPASRPPLSDYTDTDALLQFAHCEGEASARSLKDETAHFYQSNAYPCAEPEVELPPLDIVCKYAAGTELYSRACP